MDRTFKTCDRRLGVSPSRWKVLAFAIAIVTIGVQTFAPAAEAYNTRFTEYGAGFVCGNQTANQFTFSNDPEWTPGLKLSFEYGLNAWVYDIEDYNGGFLLSVGGQNWTARWESMGSAHARTQCIFPVHNIEFNIAKWGEYDQGVWSLQAVAAHEWGHAFGLSHPGENDLPFASEKPPTMATCVDVTSSARATLSRDDEAAITAQNESTGGYETATANSSFEEDEVSHKEWWSTQYVNSFLTSTSGGGVDGSSWYANFKSSVGTTQGAIYSDMFVTATNGEAYQGRANYKKNSSSDSGTINVTMKTAVYKHDSASCGGLDNTTYESGYVSRSVTCVPSNSWSYCTTSSFTLAGATGRVHRARIMVYNRMQSPLDGGTNTYVKTDRDRTMLYGYSG